MRGIKFKLQTHCLVQSTIIPDPSAVERLGFTAGKMATSSQSSVQSEQLNENCMFQPASRASPTYLPTFLTSAPVERYRPGYPRFSALLSSHPSFRNFRRFTRIRMRLLLLKQDEVSVLEERLDELDSREDRVIFLGSIRRDVNPERQQTIQALKDALEEYGAY